MLLLLLLLGVEELLLVLHSLLLHDMGNDRVKLVLVGGGGVGDTIELVGEQAHGVAQRAVLVVLHLEEVLAGHRLLRALDDVGGATENGKTHMLADQVRVRAQLDQVGVREALSKLADEALFDYLLITRLVVRNLQGTLLGERAT